jgi:hypothetical protein
MPTSAISPKLPELLLKLEFSRDILSGFDFPRVILRALVVSCGFVWFFGRVNNWVFCCAFARHRLEIATKAVDFWALQPNIAGSNRTAVFQWPY